MKKSNIGIGVLMVIVLVFSGFNYFRLKRSDKLHRPQKGTSIQLIKRNEKIAALLFGSTLSEIKQIVNEPMMGKQNILYLTTSNDCGSCVEKCFHILKKIDEYNERLYILSTNRDINRDMESYNYTRVSRFFPDPYQKVRKELNFVPTPALVFLDTSLSVQNVYILNKVNKDTTVNRIVNEIKTFLTGI